MTQVVIDDIIPRTQLTASASQTVFNTNWTADATTDILVYARASGIPPNDATQLVSSSNYNVTFIGASATVRVTFLAGRTAGDIITIVRNTPAERLNLYINTNFVPSMLNEDFGILTLVDQQAQMYDTVVAPRYNVSALIEPQTVSGGGDVVLPILPPLYGWRKNAAGTSIEAVALPDGGFAPAAAKYILQEANAFLTNAFSLGTLTNGILKQTVSGATATPAIALVDTDYYGPGMSGYIQAPAGIKDANGNIVLRFQPIGSGTNYIAVFNQISSTNPAFVAEGTGTDLGITFASKNSGVSQFSTLGNDGLEFSTGTLYQHLTLFRFIDTAASQVVTFQDASGTVAYLSDVAGTVTSAEGTENQVLVNGNFGTQETGDVIFTLPQDIGLTSSPEFFDLTLSNGFIFDDNGNESLYLPSTPSAVNYLKILNSATGVNVTLVPEGTDADVGVSVATKGTGVLSFGTLATSNQAQFVTGTAYQHATILNFANTLANRIVTFQDASGTLAFLADIPAGSPSALTRSDDTNVTLTLGGTPATALLQAVSLTMGWTGVLSMARGGSNKALTADNGGIVYSDADSLEILAATATAGQMFQSGANAAPSWSTSTYPATNAVNTLLYASSANVMAALATANNGVLITSAGGVPSISSTLPSGIAATNMALTTPSLGVATATSINFGGTSLANYLEGSITPTIVSSGGGSVTYAFQGGGYTRVGNRVIFNFQMGLATNSLSAGTITLAGLPTNCVGNVAVSIWCITLNAAAITQIMGYVVNGTTTIALTKYAAGSTTNLADTDLAATTTFIVSGSYPV